jgi:NAD(P)-dependent dehydrogenase (short-subunit alcohol dehydrogenase family)
VADALKSLLGRLPVRQLLAAGYAVAVTSRNPAELQQAVSAETARLPPLPLNLGSEASGRWASATTIGTLDLVVHDAGYGRAGASYPAGY